MPKNDKSQATNCLCNRYRFVLLQTFDFLQHWGKILNQQQAQSENNNIQSSQSVFFTWSHFNFSNQASWVWKIRIIYQDFWTLNWVNKYANIPQSTRSWHSVYNMFKSGQFITWLSFPCKNTHKDTPQLPRPYQLYTEYHMLRHPQMDMPTRPFPWVCLRVRQVTLSVMIVIRARMYFHVAHTLNTHVSLLDSQGPISLGYCTIANNYRI